MPTLSIPHEFVPHVISGKQKIIIKEDKGDQWASGRDIFFWAGAMRIKKENPYRLGYAVASRVEYVQIYPAQNKVLLQGVNIADLERFAELNGFDNWAKMKAYFGHSFTGAAISWDSIELYEPPIVESENKDEIINNLRTQLAFAQAENEELKNKLKINT